MRRLYSDLSPNSTLQDVIEWTLHISRERQGDLSDFNSQITENPRIFPVPSSSTDTIGTEKVGDVAADSSFLYVIADNAGTLEWRRVSISSF